MKSAPPKPAPSPPVDDDDSDDSSDDSDESPSAKTTKTVVSASKQIATPKSVGKVRYHYKSLPIN